MSRIAIVAAKRTAVGNFNGSLASTPAHEMSSALIKHILEETKVKSKEISEVILGQVLTTNQGQNPARQAVINADMDQIVPGWTINQVCGSGLRAVALAAQAIKAGDSKIVLAGGHENMSMSPHAMYMRSGIKMGDAKLIDTMIKDGLWDAFNDYHMGITAENIAKKFDISRFEQDEFSLRSQNKAEAAQKGERFKDEIMPFIIKERKGEKIFDQDEFIRHDATMESLSKLKPAFSKEGTVTAGNASGINDGAAVIMLMSEKDANDKDLEILGYVKSYAHAGVAPDIMGTGPIPASKKALEIAGWKVSELELVEANEAFAAQAISVNREMKWDEKIVNVNGGAIAIGHPIGASGARILVTLLYEMKKRDATKALATLCIGGGMGVAMCIEK